MVWSETLIAGGKHFRGELKSPPANPGPYQNFHASTLSEWQRKNAVEFYRDALVLAYRIPEPAKFPLPIAVSSNQQRIDAASLFDDDFDSGIALPSAQDGQPAAIEIEYAKPQTIRSLTLFAINLPVAPSPAIMPQLEAMDELGAWRKIDEMTLTAVPTTASFPAVTARRFRVLFTRGASSAKFSAFSIAPGADLGAMAQFNADKKKPGKILLVDLHFSADARVNAFEQKAAFALSDDYYAFNDAARMDEKGIAPEEVRDISASMNKDGVLDWTPPDGADYWKVLRIGYSLTGTTNHPATEEATGLEVDKYDANAVEKYFNAYLDSYREVTGDKLFGAHGLRAMVTDSTEIGPSNWTPKLIEKFHVLRGYDPTPWLPTLTGQIVDSRQRSDAFLYDFRRTLAQLSATEHYGTAAKIAHRNGLILYGESLEGSRATLGDDIEMRRFADLPMGALWAFGKDREPSPNLQADLRGAASAAHIYGQNLVAAESLTSILQPWAYAPSDLQPMIDVEFVNGVNRPVIHTSVHQPNDKVPGLSLMLFGQFFTRHETWAEMAKPWIDYIARNSYLLQQGRNVADVAYFYGEEAPISVQARNGYFTNVPTHYAYDFMPPDAVLNRLSVDAGNLVTSSGAHYKVLYLGSNSQYMTLPVLRKLAELVNAGATLVGKAPKGSPSLHDDAGEVSQWITTLWSGAEITLLGKGRVIDADDIESALAKIAITPDFEFTSEEKNSVYFVHRQLSDGDIYYVSNRSDAQRIQARFRVTGKAPEVWHADTGKIEEVSYRIDGDVTIVPLDLLAKESYFVVFRKSAKKMQYAVQESPWLKLSELDGSWNVAFQINRGAPEKIHLDALAPLSEQDDPGIKYFSGVSTYTKTFSIPKNGKAGKSLLLDLGRVGDIAEVRVNGKFVGTTWKAPYQIDIGTFVHPGNNDLDIRVANLWVNRLIGDKQPDARPITFTTVKTYIAKAPLRPSGLIGPVTLWARQ